MRMGRIELGAAILASALVTAIGLFLGLTNEGTDAAAFGWLIAVVGAVSLVTNLFLRSRLR
jgi:hypothetical protein